MPDETVLCKECNNNFELLLALYNINQSEITRYRDREWAVPSIFIAAMIAVITSMIVNNSCLYPYFHQIKIFLFLLALGNTFYLLFTHKRLTQKRNTRTYLEEKFSQQDYSTLEKEELFEDIKKMKITDKDFVNGFWDHILIFTIIGWVLFIFGHGI